METHSSTNITAKMSVISQGLMLLCSPLRPASRSHWISSIYELCLPMLIVTMLYFMEQREDLALSSVCTLTCTHKHTNTHAAHYCVLYWIPGRIQLQIKCLFWNRDKEGGGWSLSILISSAGIHPGSHLRLWPHLHCLMTQKVVTFWPFKTARVVTTFWLGS